MNAPLPTILDTISTVEHTPGLLAPWQIEAGRTEIRHDGAWRVVDEIQPAAAHPIHGTARVYLRLRPVVDEISTIDPKTGIVSTRPATLADGDAVLTEAHVPRRARLLSDLELAEV